MERKKYLEDIQEPCYFDFLYEEIKHQTEAEILNTILFEAILRTKDIKTIIDNFPDATSNLNNNLEVNVSGNIKNPLYERIHNFHNEISEFYKMLEILSIKHDNTISKEDIIQLFFNGDVNKYKSSLDALIQIQDIIKEKLLPNINSDINLDDNFEQKSNKLTISLLDSFNKYGLDFNNIMDYLHQFNNFLNKQNNEKEILYDELLNSENPPNKLFAKYSNYIKLICQP